MKMPQAGLPTQQPTSPSDGELPDALPATNATLALGTFVEAREAFECRPCPICKQIGVVHWFPIAPESQQGLKKKLWMLKFRWAIQGHIRREIALASKADGFAKANNVDVNGVAYKACVHLFFGLSRYTSDKDVDNMAKGVFDAISGAGGLLSDDKLVQHSLLEKHVLSEVGGGHGEAYLIGVRISRLLEQYGVLTYKLGDFVNIKGKPSRFGQ